jgi:hypothetical protein
MNRSKWLLNGAAWAMVIYIVIAISASIISLSNCLDFTEWGEFGRFTWVVFSLVAFALCFAEEKGVGI